MWAPDGTFPSTSQEEPEGDVDTDAVSPALCPHLYFLNTFPTILNFALAEM